MTVTGEPIPHELAIPPADRVDHQLASVIDLSAPRQVTESLEAMPAPRLTPTTHLGKPAKRGFPLAAPPPTHPGIDPVPATVPATAPATSPPAVPSSPRADRVTSSGVALPAPPEGPPPVAVAAASFVAAPVASAPFVIPAPADLRATPSGPFATAPPSPTAPRRAAWPMVVVITGAAMVGSLAMALLMRSGFGAAPSAASVPRAAVSPVTAAKRPPEGTTVESIEPPGSGAGSAASAGMSPPVAEPGAPTRAEAVAPALMAAPVVPHDGSPAQGPASTALKAATRVPRGSPGASPLRASDPRDRLGDEISRLYQDGRYGQVVSQCGKVAVSAERAPMCFIAACHVGDEAAARRLLALVPAPARDHLVTNCKQFGVDLQKEACEADPMSCQH